MQRADDYCFELHENISSVTKFNIYMKLIFKKRELDHDHRKELVKWQYLFLRVFRSHEVENFDTKNNFHLFLYEKLIQV